MSKWFLFFLFLLSTNSISNEIKKVPTRKLTTHTLQTQKRHLKKKNPRKIKKIFGKYKVNGRTSKVKAKSYRPKAKIIQYSYKELLVSLNIGPHSQIEE